MSLNGSMADFLTDCGRSERLVFALENEVGHGQERASVVGIAAIQTSLCAASIVMRQRAHAIERARFTNERDQSFWLHRIEFFFFQNASDQFARVAMPILHRVDQRQSDFAFLEIAENGLAQLLCGGGEIEKVVDELERETSVTAVFGKREFVGIFDSAENRAEARAPAEEACGLVGCQLERVLFGDVHVTNLGKLEQFTFDHFLGEVDQDIENAEIAFFERHLERLHVKPVAGENAAVVAPARIRGRTAAARVGAVDHIVVNQGRAVKEFDNCRELDRGRTAMTGVTRGEQQQRGAKALPSSAEEVARNFGNRQESSRGLSRQFFFHKDEIVSDEIENLPGCEQRDGFPPCLHKPFSRNALQRYVAHFRPKATISDDRTVSCALTKPSIEITLSIHPGGCERKRRGLRQGPTHTCHEAVCCFVSSLKKRRKFADVA